jgi:membrane-associated PAP2 superfamily phosphatase
MTDLANTDGGPARGPRRLSLAQGLRRGATRLRLSLAAGLGVTDPLTLALAATVALSLYFMVLPGVDMAVSGLFFSAEGFALSQDPGLRALRQSSSGVLGLMLLGLLVTLAVGLWRGGGRLDGSARRAGVLVAGLALGSGLLVNGVLKSMWGRARPVQVEAFGGEAAFTPAWTLSDNCLDNCSFVSGEASSAAWMVAVVALMVPPAWRPWALPAVLTYAGALSLNRLAFGGHFLSDVLLSWTLTALVLAALCRLTLTCPRAARRIRRARRARTAVAG